MNEQACLKCGGDEFAEGTEGTDYMPIKTSKLALTGSNKIFTFCLSCGEVDSIRIENTTTFKKG